MRSYGDGMRGWGQIGTTALGLLLVLPAGCAREAPAMSPSTCRAAWEDLQQTQGENGSIAPDGTATAARWQEEYDAAGRRSGRPGDPAACRDDLAAARARFAALVDLGSAIQRYDLATRLTQAERDLEHARGLGSFETLPPPLDEAFADLREAAPEVHGALSEVESRAADVDLGDERDVARLASDLRDAATGSPSYDRGRRALEVIGRYELDEE